MKQTAWIWVKLFKTKTFKIIFISKKKPAEDLARSEIAEKDNNILYSRHFRPNPRKTELLSYNQTNQAKLGQHETICSKSTKIGAKSRF